MNKLNKKSHFPVHLAVAGIVFFTAALLFSGCFSPWGGDEGTLSINLGGNGQARAGWNIYAENGKYSHEIILEGPGGTIRKTIDGGSRSASFQLVPGTWQVTVRAMGERPEGPGFYYADHGFPETMLKALGYADVVIKAGQKSSASMDMATATEVFNEEQLSAALGWLSSDIEEYVLVANDIPDLDGTIPVSAAATLLADRNVRITRGVGHTDIMFELSGTGTRLTLGRPGMKGSLTIDGSGNNVDGSILFVNSDALAVINEGVALINNNVASDSGGAIYLNGGILIMNGGAISNNSSSTSANDGKGGGVYMNNGIFTMNGGVISGNACDGRGGGVCVGDGIFTMTGGRISGNMPVSLSDPLHGGGVYVGGNASFTMQNNSVVSGNSCYGGGGVHVEGRFTMEGNTAVSGNYAVFGGGVFAETSGSTFLMRGNASVSANSVDAVFVQGIFYMRENASVSANEGYGIQLLSNFTPFGRFFIEGGTVYGHDERNPALSNQEGSIFKQTGSCVAEYGTLDETETWSRVDDLMLSGLTETNETIRVANGVLLGH